MATHSEIDGPNGSRAWYERVDMSYPDNSYNPVEKFRDVVIGQILPIVQRSDKENDVVINLGSLKGKWIKEIVEVLSPKKLVCVDMMTTFFEHLENTFVFEDTKLEFVTTRGNELSKIESGTVDCIISFDALTVGLSDQDVVKYIKEFRRVLKTGGKALIHFAICQAKEEGSPDSPFEKQYENLKISRVGGFGFVPEKSQFILFQKLGSDPSVWKCM